MKFDETELIGFFGELPSEQDPEEKEFFGTTIFDFKQGSYCLSISFSIYHKDFYLTLRSNGLTEPLLEISLEEIEEIRVEQDKLTPEDILTVRSGRSAINSAGQGTKMIEVRLYPHINIKVKNQ